MARIQASGRGARRPHGPDLDGTEDGAGQESAGECCAEAVDGSDEQVGGEAAERVAGERHHPASGDAGAGAARVRGGAMWCGGLTWRAPFVGWWRGQWSGRAVGRRSRPRGGCPDARRGGRGRARRAGPRCRAGVRRRVRPAVGRGSSAACSAARGRGGSRSPARIAAATRSGVEVESAASTRISVGASGCSPIRRWRRAVSGRRAHVHRGPGADGALTTPGDTFATGDAVLASDGAHCRRSRRSQGSQGW